MSFYKNPIFWIVLLFIVYLLLPSNTSTSYVSSSSSSSVDELTKIQNTIDNFNAVFNDVNYEDDGAIKFRGNNTNVVVTKKSVLDSVNDFEFYVEVPFSQSKYTSSNTYNKFNVISDMSDIYVLKSSFKNVNTYSGRTTGSFGQADNTGSTRKNVALAFRYIFNFTTSAVDSNSYGAKSSSTSGIGTGIATVTQSDSNKKPISLRFD